jgi:DNA-binding XRE family transcriptional regulator
MLGWTIEPDKLRALREELRRTPKEMAEEVGCHRCTWNNLERGQQPSAELTWRITATYTRLLGRAIEVADIATPRATTSAYARPAA